MESFIKQFLALNPEPSDAQVHALADALGADHAALEAVMYRMLGRQLTANAEEVLEGDIDPDLMPLNEVTLNDGDPTDDDLGVQEETTDDGIDIDDNGIGVTIGDDDVLTDDGIPDVSL